MQWFFEHIIMRIFSKQMNNWYHREVYEPLTKPLPSDYELTEEDWERSRKYDKEIFAKIN